MPRRHYSMHQDHIHPHREASQRVYNPERYYNRDSNPRRITQQSHDRHHKPLTRQWGIQHSYYLKRYITAHPHHRTTTRQHNYTSARNTHHRFHFISTSTQGEREQSNSFVGIPSHYHYNNSNIYNVYFDGLKNQKWLKLHNMSNNSKL